MIDIQPTPLAGLFLIVPQAIADERGSFSRVYCRDIFGRAGLCTDFPQWSVSFNRKRGTLRGLHFQAAPYAETKLVRCNAGAIFDVAVDLRPESEQFGKWYGIELTAADHRALYIPTGFAHGFQTLTDEADVIYHISEPYRAEAARGVRWDDPTIGVTWPAAETRIISERDRALPLLDGR